MSKKNAFSPEQELELVRQARGGDEGAFEQLYNANRQVAIGMYNQYRPKGMEADDVVNSTFFNAWKNLHRFREDARFSTWVSTIARNVCLDKMRKGKSRPELSAHELPQDQADALFAEGAGRLTPSDEKRIVDSQLIRQAFQNARIDEQTTAIFLAKELQGKSVEEIAHDIGMNENTIKVKLFRARQRLVPAANRLCVPRPPLAARTREIVA